MIPVVQDLLKQAIRTVYSINSRDPTTKVIDEVKRLIKKKNEGKLPQEQLAVPSNNTIYRFIARLDALDGDDEDSEVVFAKKLRAPTGLGPHPTRPNQRWEFDFTQLDVLVVDRFDRLPIGRPTIATLRDKYTGYPVGIIMSFEPPSYRLVMECLMYAIVEKVQVKQTFHLINDYLPYGVPETLVVDNAMELHRDLELACLQLGIELIHTPVKKPWFKGSIERWFRTLAKDLIHTLPGSTFSNFLERGDYDSQKYACMTLDGLWELLHRWIVDDYAQTPHRGLGEPGVRKGIPSKLWERALQEQFVPSLPPNRDELFVLVSRTEERTVWHYGIEFENLVYQDTTLIALRTKLKQPDAPKKIKIKYYPGNLSRIWAQDPFTKKYLEVRAVEEAYTAGLSLWKHRMVKRYISEELKRDVNEDTLLLAREQMQKQISHEFRLNKKIRSRMGAARWFDFQVMTWLSESVTDRHLEQSFPVLDSGRQEETCNASNQAPEVPLLPLSSALEAEQQIATENISDLGEPLSDLLSGVSLVEQTLEEEQSSPLLPLPREGSGTSGNPHVSQEVPGQSGKKAGPKKDKQSMAPAPPQPPVPPSPQSFGIEVSYTRPSTHRPGEKS